MSKCKYTREMLQDAIAGCTSIRTLLLHFGLKETGGNYSAMMGRIKKFNLDATHFTGQGWAKGKTQENNPTIYKMARRMEVPEELILVKSDTKIVSSVRLRSIVKKYIPYVCSMCHNTGEWLGTPLTLQVDHINGDCNDNRLENLRFLCPNCHTQTPTWGARNIRKKVVPSGRVELPEPTV